MRIKISILLIAMLFIIGCPGPKSSKSDDMTNLVTLESGLRFIDLEQGSGSPAKRNNAVTVNMIIFDESNNEIENTYKSKRPVNFTIGNKEVIDGLEEGVMGMKVGGKRKLYIPPELGFAKRAQRQIPSNSNLIIVVELNEIK